MMMTPMRTRKIAGDMVFNPLPEAYPDGQAPIIRACKN